MPRIFTLWLKKLSALAVCNVNKVFIRLDDEIKARLIVPLKRPYNHTWLNLHKVLLTER